MAISVLQWVWDHSRSRHGSRLVLLALADCARDDGISWPSVAELTRKTNLGERAVHTAIADLVKLGELEVFYNAGPRGCNRYQITQHPPAESAPPQNLHPAEPAPPQNLQGQESSQVNVPPPAESAPPADIAGVQISTPDPAESAPGTVIDPEKSSTKTSSRGGAGETGALSGTSKPAAAKRGRRLAKTDDPDFDRWYAVYPVHKARGDAEQAWKQTRDIRPDTDTLIAATEQYREDDRVRRGWAKNPATWLRGKCWLDEPGVQRQPPPNGSPAGKGKPINYADEEYTGGW